MREAASTHGLRNGDAADNDSESCYFKILAVYLPRKGRLRKKIPREVREVPDVRNREGRVEIELSTDIGRDRDLPK